MNFLTKITQHDYPVIMGILNATPDSFSDGGSYNHIDKAILKALSMVEEGAAIIDIGGESTRPGATPISDNEECDRVLPIIEKLKENAQVAISVDTSKALVMKEAVALGVDMINDVCALQNHGALDVVSKSKIDICLMHKQGIPKNMQKAPQYNNIVDEINSFFKARLDECKKAGIKKQRLCLDPGFGFGKTIDHNYQMLKQLDSFNCFGLPILSGISRKSMIGDLCKVEVNKRLSGSITSAIIAVQNNAKIVRVHDVFETHQALQVLLKTQQA